MSLPVSTIEKNARRQRVVALLEEAAAKGARCPQNHEFGVMNAGGVLSALAGDGTIRVEVFGKNWRVITMLAGAQKGRRTLAPPFANDGPYKVIDKGGSHRPREKWGTAA
jgi:hypothetical protein